MIPRNSIQLFALGALTLLGACKKNASADAAPLDSSLVASLERGPCFGRCPVYKVELYGDGRVRYEGMRFVKDTGKREGATSTAEVQKYLRAVSATQFASADSAYTMENKSACGNFSTDMPVAVLTVKLAGGLKTVRHDPGCRGAPEYLRTLEAQLDTVTRSATWISGNGEQK
ncbi:MAG: DUF6438 domain-containing protein [Gemmatimonas sp.]